ncbi:MAG: DUF4390 domain-containing protein, partial [Lysobacterales bacterium]
LCPALACLLALLAGCSPAESNFGFSVTRVECRFSGESLHVAVQQQLILSNEAKEALIHGVPLVFQTRVMVRARRSHEELQQDNRVFEIRYLPLSERYQLSASPPLEVHTFPRLRHALGELTTVEFTFANLQMPPADMELRVRSQLDKRQTPPPMRLPVWFSAQWNHDSGWTSWPLGTGSGP